MASHGGSCYNLYLADEATEAQRGLMKLLRLTELGRTRVMASGKL